VQFVALLFPRSSCLPHFCRYLFRSYTTFAFAFPYSLCWTRSRDGFVVSKV
jgi:hypothetical protein